MEGNFNRHLGSKLRMRRLSLGLTQTKVAQAINVTFQQIQKYEKGTNGISSLRLMQLASFLKVSVMYFFEDLKVESTVKLPEVLDCPWAISPGGSLDPAIFVNYVRKKDGERVLWDYNFDISDSERTFYILSTIPTEFNVAVNGVFGGKDVASDFIQDIGKLGIAIGGEALKSGRNALGVVGLVGTIRLLMNSFTDENGPGFLIPVDSFTSFFGSGDQNRKRSDLLAIQLKLPSNGTTQLEIYVCGVESKYVSSTFNRNKAISALQQAKASFDDFRELNTTRSARYRSRRRR